MKLMLILSIPAFLLLSSCGSGSASSSPSGNPIPGAASGVAIQLSTDPFTDTTAQHQTAVEPSILAQGSTIVAAFQVGRIRSGASDAMGWATSKDGGATWARGFVPGLTTNSGGSNVETTDAVVAYDAKHGVWMIESLVYPTGGSASSAVVSRSADALTWSAPVTIASGTLDKNWITCDNGASSPDFGHCYSEWDDSSTQQVFMTVSTDGGLTWSSPQGSPDSATGIGGQFAIRPNGQVLMPFYNANSSNRAILSVTSNDGGQSWSSSTTIAPQQAAAIPTRGETDPQVTIQPNGTINVAWFDCRFESGCSANDIVMISSTDGATWSSPVKISPDAVGSGINHFLPAIAANPSNGSLALTYYTAPQGCADASCSATAWFTHSTNGGSSWSTPIALTPAFPLSEVASDPEGPMLGDYFSIAFAGGAAFPAFSAPVSPGSPALNQQIFTIPIPGI